MSTFSIRRKNLLKEMTKDIYVLPTEKQQIVRVMSNRGSNLHEVQTAEEIAEKFLASMPNRLRGTILIKHGDYVLVEPIEDGDKVKAKICKILTTDHVKEYTKAGVWPKAFGKKREHDQVKTNSDEDTNDDDFLMKNPNKPALMQEVSDTDECDEDGDEDE